MAGVRERYEREERRRKMKKVKGGRERRGMREEWNAMLYTKGFRIGLGHL